MLSIEKDSRLLGKLTIKKIPKSIAKSMILKNHYSNSWNAGFGKINYGMYLNDVLVGAAVFGNMLNVNAHSHIVTTGSESLIELNRLWISDVLGKNAETILISSSFKLIKYEYPQIKFIQSYADGRLGCGTIYKASNFKYYGYTETLFLEVNNLIYHKILFENTSRPITYLYLNAKYLDNDIHFFKVKTYRYIYSLYNDYSGILLDELPYPEYNKGISPTEHQAGG